MVDSRGRGIIRRLATGLCRRVFRFLCGDDPGAVCLFFRPLAFDYRGKIANARWRALWDTGLVIGSLVPPVVFGIAFGNLFLGVPFAFTPQLHVDYFGTFWQLLSPFALLCGLLSLSLVIMQGASGYS